MGEHKPSSPGLTHAVDKIFQFVEYFIAALLVVMVFFTFMNVVLRQFHKGFVWSEELCRICFIYLAYLGAIIAARENAHLMVDTLFVHLKGGAQKALYVVIQLIIIATMGYLSVGAWMNAWKNRNDFWVATGFPVFMVHFAGVLLGVSVILISLVNLYRLLVKKEDARELFSNATDADENGEGAGIQ